MVVTVRLKAPISLLTTVLTPSAGKSHNARFFVALQVFHVMFKKGAGAVVFLTISLYQRLLYQHLVGPAHFHLVKICCIETCFINITKVTILPDG